MVDRHGLQVVTSEPSAVATPSREGATPQLGLSWLDRLAATACADGETTALIELVRASAESLCGDTPDAARARLLAREVAIAKVTLDLLVALLGERLGRGDDRGALALDKLATGAARRLALLTAEHRAETRSPTGFTIENAIVHVAGAR